MYKSFFVIEIIKHTIELFYLQIKFMSWNAFVNWELTFNSWLLPFYLNILSLSLSFFVFLKVQVLNEREISEESLSGYRSMRIQQRHAIRPAERYLSTRDVLQSSPVTVPSRWSCASECFNNNESATKKERERERICVSTLFQLSIRPVRRKAGRHAVKCNRH